MEDRKELIINCDNTKTGKRVKYDTDYVSIMPVANVIVVNRARAVDASFLLTIVGQRFVSNIEEIIFNVDKEVGAIYMKVVQFLEFRNLKRVYINSKNSLPFRIADTEWYNKVSADKKQMIDFYLPANAKNIKLIPSYTPDAWQHYRFIVTTPLKNIDMQLRASIIYTMLKDPSYYDKKYFEDMIGWINKNSALIVDSLCERTPACCFQAAVVMVMSDRVQMSYQAFCSLLNCELVDIEEKAALTERFRKMYNVEKMQLAESKKQSKDLINPARIHAIKQDWCFKYNGDGTVSITSYKGPKVQTLYVPSTIGKKKVVKLGHSALFMAEAKEIIVPESVVELGKNVFSGCKAETIEIRGKIASIPSCAFENTLHLRRLILPEDSIEFIDSEAFCMSAIRSLVVPKSVKVICERAFIKSEIEYVHIDGAVIANKAFDSCKNLKTVKISNSSYIANEAFASSSSAVLYLSNIGHIGHHLWGSEWGNSTEAIHVHGPIGSVSRHPFGMPLTATVYYKPEYYNIAKSLFCINCGEHVGFIEES